MKKIIVFLIALLGFCHLQAQNIKGHWQVADYKLKQNIDDKDKLAFVVGASISMSFKFSGSTLLIYNPMLDKPTKYNWKYTDKEKTLIDAVEANPLFKDSPSRWKFRVLKIQGDNMELEDLGKGKEGDVWVLTRKK